METVETKQPMITALFRDRENAQNAYHWLLDHGYSQSELSLVMSDNAPPADAVQNKPTDAPATADAPKPEGSVAPGAIGSAVGASLAALAAVGVRLAIPGFGLLVAGPIVAGIADAGAGALTEGSVAGLMGLGISEKSVKTYELALREGALVFGVVPHTEDESALIKTYFEKIGGEAVTHA